MKIVRLLVTTIWLVASTIVIVALGFTQREGDLTNVWQIVVLAGIALLIKGHDD